MTDPLRLPPAMVQRARAFTGTPAQPRAAATVVLLRPEPPTLSVYVLKRATTMVFGGVYAFPGGGVDPSDSPETIRTDWPDRLGIPADRAHAVVGAAARELFEEAGVLLAAPRNSSAHSASATAIAAGNSWADRAHRDVGTSTSDGSSEIRVDTVGDISGQDWEADRAAVQRRELTMTELLDRRGLRLRDDLLLPWARWITPEFEPKRFDTWFFVALLPAGQTARDVSGEADHATWIRPAAADGLAMLPPTRSMVRDIAAYREMAEVIAAASRRDAATPVLPRVELTEDGGALLHL